MDREAQRAMVERVIALNAGRTTTLAETALAIPASTYVSPERHAREMRDGVPYPTGARVPERRHRRAR